MKQQTDIERAAELLNRFNACLDVDEREGTVRSMMTFFAELIRAISGTHVTSGDIYDTAKVLEEQKVEAGEEFDQECRKWTEPIGAEDYQKAIDKKRQGVADAEQADDAWREHQGEASE